MQIITEEFKARKLTLNGVKEDWWEYWLSWNNIYRVAEENSLGVIVYKWLRSGADHWCHATLYWRVGMSKFASSGSGQLIGKDEEVFGLAPEIKPDGTALHSIKGLGNLYINDNTWRVE